MKDPSRRWLDYEDEFLQKYSCKITQEDIAVLLNRPLRTIKYKQSLNGVLSCSVQITKAEAYEEAQQWQVARASEYFNKGVRMCESSLHRSSNPCPITLFDWNSFNTDRSYVCNTCKIDREYYRKYTIVVKEFEWLSRLQSDVCYICHRPEVRVNKSGEICRMSIDHDHACCPALKACKKCIRGLLCTYCNVNIIGFFDNLFLLDKYFSSYTYRRPFLSDEFKKWEQVAYGISAGVV